MNVDDKSIYCWTVPLATGAGIIRFYAMIFQGLNNFFSQIIGGTIGGLLGFG